MINRALILILTSFAFACSSPQAVHAKSSAPVAIDYSVPDDAGIGDQVTTKIHFTANKDMKLVVSAAAYSGMTLIAGGEEMVISDLKSGESRTMEVTVRLDEGMAYLAVYAATTDSLGKERNKNITIRYGNAKSGSSQKISTDSNGEIFMPAEPR